MGLLTWLRGLLHAGEPAPEEQDDVDDPFAGETFPVRDVIDLHGLPPKMVPEVVTSYLEEARRLGFRHVRIVHGKGIGVQREVVRSILSRTPWVEDYSDAPAEAGGWGATVARLRLHG
jgi:dsDNA-specific endonuclease/ATPase MutS2